MSDQFKTALERMESASNGVYEIGIFSTVRELYPSSPTPLNDIRRHAMVQWATRVPEVKPLCLSCDKVWQSFDDNCPPPSAFGYIQPNVPLPPALMLTAICVDCCENSSPDDLIKAMMALARNVVPECKFIDAASLHAMHEVKQ